MEDTEVKVINDHFIVVKALKSERFNFGEDGAEMWGVMKPEILSDVADQYRGVPIYVDHQRTKFDQVGVVRSAFFKNPFIYAVVELYSRTTDQNMVIDYIKNGHIKAVSSGFNFEYTQSSEDKIEIFNVNPFELSLMLDWSPKCPDCKVEYRNFGVKVKKEGENDMSTDNIPLVWLETNKDGNQNIVISNDAEKYGLKEPILKALETQKQGDAEKTKEVVLEVDGDFGNAILEVVKPETSEESNDHTKLNGEDDSSHSTNATKNIVVKN